MKNPKKPFKVICTNCGVEVEKKHVDSVNDINFDKEEIEIVGQPFYDSADVYIECGCGNEIKI